VAQQAQAAAAVGDDRTASRSVATQAVERRVDGVDRAGRRPRGQDRDGEHQPEPHDTT
jgi:hypothetical protein